jgi:hypothetical protein|tara:strand:- start:2154 stop:2453 length:300 start_codon:yes stop_codon:yes gene_type:complete
MEDTELDELESGLTSGFWRRLQAHCTLEWGVAGEAYQSAVRAAISGPIGSESEAIQRLKSLTTTQQAVTQLLGWPQQRAQQLRNRTHTTTVPLSRRGGL